MLEIAGGVVLGGVALFILSIIFLAAVESEVFRSIIILIIFVAVASVLGLWAYAYA